MVMLHLIETHCVPLLTYAIEIVHVANKDDRMQLRVSDRRSGGLDVWRSGGLKVWRSGGLEVCRSGGLEPVLSP